MINKINFLFYIARQIVKKIILGLIILLLKKKGVKIANNDVGVACLLCKRDVNMFILSLKSLFYFLDTELPVYIIDDGTLTKRDKVKIKKYFYAEIVSKEKSDRKMEKVIKGFRYFRDIRFNKESAIYKYKFDLIFSSKFNQTILIDPDIIFQKKPTEIIKWIESKSKDIFYTVHDDSLFKSGYSPEYSFRTLLFKYLKTKMSGGFSSGLLLLPRIDRRILKKMDLISKLISEVYWSKSDNIDEVLLSALFSQLNNAKALPKEKYYIMAFEEQYSKEKERKATLIHYGHQTTSKFYNMAFKLISSTNFFKT